MLTLGLSLAQVLWAQGRGLPVTHFVPVTMRIAAAIGIFALGHWQDRVGHRPALAITLWGWIVMTLLAAGNHRIGILGADLFFVLGLAVPRRVGRSACGLPQGMRLTRRQDNSTIVLFCKFMGRALRGDA